MTTTSDSNATAVRRAYVHCKACRAVYEVQADRACPTCHTARPPLPQENYLTWTARAYGTDAVPKWNLGLGSKTSGKSDFLAQARAKKLVPDG